MNALENAGARAIEHMTCQNALKIAKADLLERMGQFDAEFNGFERVHSNSPLYPQLALFCADQFNAKSVACRAVYSAKRRLAAACRKAARQLEVAA